MYASVRIALTSRRLMTREVFAAYLRAHPDFEVVGHTSGLADLDVLCELRQPDVVLIDLRDPAPGLVDLLRQLHERFADVALVGLYDQGLRLSLDEIYRAGVAAVVPASHGLDALVLTLREHGSHRPVQTNGRLTESELDVLWLMNSGHGVAEMAEVLGISPRTVENRKRRIYAKLNAHSQSHAVARGASLGITPGDVRRPRLPVEGGRAIVVLIRGRPGALTDRLVGALVTHGVAFVLDRSAWSALDDYPPWWYPGPVIAVLADPTPADWAACRLLGVPILLVSGSRPGHTEVIEALLEGAGAAISADDLLAHLLPVLAVLASGYAAVHRNDLAPLVELMVAGPGPRGLPDLTARETQILLSADRGESVRQTARALGIATKTVENTQARMFRKLGVRNRAGALVIAHRLGLLNDVRIDPDVTA